MKFSGELGGVGDRFLDEEGPHWHNGRFVLFRFGVLEVYWTSKSVALSSLILVKKSVNMTCMFWNASVIAEFRSSREASWAEEGVVCSRGARLCCCGRDAA